MPQKKKVLVTGGAGYIGSCVVELLVERGHHPVVFDTFYWGREPVAPFAGKITELRGDIRSSGDLVYALQGVDAVIHLAGIVGQPACAKNRLASHTTNVESTRTLVNCMTDPGLALVRDLIFCSSCSVYGNVEGLYEEVTETTPTMALSEYAQSKLAGERIIMEAASEIPHLSPTILRLTTIFGWSHRLRLDLVTNHFTHKALTERQLTLHGDGSQYRSLVHVRDVARALVTMLEAPRYLRDRQVFHVGEETNNLTLREMAEIVKRCLPETKIEYSSNAATDRRDYRISCQKIKNVLDWKAEYSVEMGIRELIGKLQSMSIDASDVRYWNISYDYR